MGEKRDRSSQLAEKFGCIGNWCFGNGYYALSEADAVCFDMRNNEEREYSEYCFTKCLYMNQCWDAFLEENNCSCDDDEKIEYASFTYFMQGIKAKPTQNH